MIYESQFWKNELLAIAKKLKTKTTFRSEWSDKKNAKLEKWIMFGFYIIRKLLEAKKLTSDYDSKKIECTVYKSESKTINWMNRFELEELYNLSNPISEKRELRFFINQIVHSYIFLPVIGYCDPELTKNLKNTNLTEDEIIELHENALMCVEGIYVNSDNNKKEYLFELDLLEIIELFEDIGTCFVTKVDMKYDPQKEDYKHIRFSTFNKKLDE